MDFFQLQCFLQIVRSKSFSETAYGLSISQSSVSKHISKLEAELEVPLFERSSTGVSLTPAGEAFRIHAEAILREYEGTLLDMKRYHAKTEIRFGCIENIAKSGFTEPISAYIRSHSDLRLSLTLGNTPHLLELMESGRANPVLITALSSTDGRLSNLNGRNFAGCEAYLLSVDEYLAIMAEDHPLAGKDSLSWKDILAEPWIFFDRTYSLRKMLEDIYKQYSAVPNITIECNSVDNILGLVAWKSGITLLPDSISRRGYEVKAIPLEQPIVRHELLLVKSASLKKRSIREFVEFVLDHYRADAVADVYPLPGSSK